MSLLVRDEELRAAGVSELDIDALDRLPATQKGLPGIAFDARDRKAVEEWLRVRGLGPENLSGIGV